MEENFDIPVDNEESFDELLHYGTKYHSGRYPYGSGEDPYQHSGDLLSRIEQMKQEGLTEVEIAKAMNTTTGKLRVQISLATNERRMQMVASAKSLKADGLNYSEIGRRTGINESTVRSLLNSESEARMSASQNTANFLKEKVDSLGMIDIGKGVEKELGVSKKKRYYFDPITGKKLYEETNREYSKAEIPGIDGKVNVVVKNGVKTFKNPNSGKYEPIPPTAKITTVKATTESTKMMETDDAFTLVSDANNPKERAYANYANKMKAMANEARIELYNTGKLEYSPSAKAAYDTEARRLTAQLNIALKNAPKERRAQLLANSRIKAKEQENPDMSKKDKKKYAQQELTRARLEVGAKRNNIEISDREWEAIQRAIDEIIKYDPLNIYKKVERTS